MAKKQITPWRHSRDCKICNSPRRSEIERMFLQWQPQAKIAKEFALGNRQIIFRHARATGLFEKRATNIRSTLLAVIERGMDVPRMRISAAVIVQATVALSKLDSEGRSIERIERIDRAMAFLDDPRWTRGEMLRYAETGELPAWLKEDLPDTPVRASGPSDKPN
jgi:hypothetical protein